MLFIVDGNSLGGPISVPAGPAAARPRQHSTGPLRAAAASCGCLS